MIIKSTDKITNIIYYKTEVITVTAVDRETLYGSENLNYESDEKPNGLNYGNKGNKQGTGIETLQGTNWLDDIVGQPFQIFFY